MFHLGLDNSVASILWLAELTCFLLSVFWRPTIGLYLLIPLLPLQTIRYRLHEYFLGAQFTDLLLLGVAIGLWRQGRPLFPKSGLKTLFVVYVVYTYLSMFRGSLFLGIDFPLWFDDPRVSDWKNYVVVLPLLFFFTLSAVRTKRQMGAVIFCIMLALLALTRNFHSYMADRDLSSFSYDVRTAGAMGFAGVNGLAALEAQVAVLLLALCLGSGGFLTRAGYLGVLASCSYCLAYALSRGAYAAFLLGVFFLGVLRHRVLLIGLVVFLISWQSFVPAVVSERILMTTDQSGEVEHSAAARLSLWDEAMEVFKADPVFGTGFNTYRYGSHVGGYGDTHNVYVKVLVETGLVGLTIFCMILHRLFSMGFRLYRSAQDPFLKALGLGFAGLMVAAVVGNLFGDRWMYFQITGFTYALAALVARGQEMTDEAQEEEEPEAAESAGDLDALCDSPAAG